MIQKDVPRECPFFIIVFVPNTGKDITPSNSGPSGSSLSCQKQSTLLFPGPSVLTPLRTSKLIEQLSSGDHARAERTFVEQIQRCEESVEELLEEANTGKRGALGKHTDGTSLPTVPLSRRSFIKNVHHTCIIRTVEMWHCSAREER